MALVIGTNAGFVTTAPTADPESSSAFTIDSKAFASKFTSPLNAIKITEIGWWCSDATEEANFEVGIYTHNSGDDNPEAVVGSLNQTNAKGTGVGWKVVTGLDITISSETTYWLAVQLDDTPTSTRVDIDSTSGGKFDWKSPQTELSSPWGVSGFTNDWKSSAIYAVVETASSSATDNMSIIGENVY